MDSNVFEINGLACAYVHQENGRAKVVLRIEKLSVPRGRITVILGLSGSGKSTLIETLGLMNHTIEHGTITYRHRDGTVTIDREIWKHPGALTAIRNRHFSFIFQKDFLMPCYSAEENMLAGLLIGGARQVSPSDMENLQVLCCRMGLNYPEICRKMPSELSVGQKQRLSFIRAVLKNYSVIFGDEPTGNLDEVNAGLLMDVLHESVAQDPWRSAVLVSHNISLSVAKADCIVVLSPQNGMYEILPGNVFTRNSAGWLRNGRDQMSGELLSECIREIVKARG
jgi:ABC-type lipoprotein export system ATPase subunit